MRSPGSPRLVGSRSAEENTTFSIIIPTKEEASYIERSLAQWQLAREHARVSFDVIVVDGASTDETAQRAAALADRVVTDSDAACLSIAHARNAGANASLGRFLFHTDADVLVPDPSAFLERALRQFDDPRVVAVTALVMPYPWEATLRDRLIHLGANLFFRSSLRYGALFARGECQLVRRSAFELVGGYTGQYISGEDCDLFRRLNRIGRIRYIPGARVYHSPRRFRQVGYLRVLGIYLREWIWMNVFHRSFMSEWPVVR